MRAAEAPAAFGFPNLPLIGTRRVKDLVKADVNKVLKDIMAGRTRILVLKMSRQASSELKSDSCFPNSSGAGNCDETAFVEQSLDFAKLKGASEQ